MKRNTIFCAISIALSLAFIGPVLAQTDQAADVNQEAEGVLEEVIATGSRIRRDSFNVSTPLVNMENDQIQDTGLGSIPSSLIQRVEIVTGGSSATYGSDAVAGVVNIITVNDRVGFTVNGRYGWTPEGGGGEYTLDANYGLEFGDGRGYFFIGAEYMKQDVIDQHHRDRARWEANTMAVLDVLYSWVQSGVISELMQ